MRKIIVQRVFLLSGLLLSAQQAVAAPSTSEVVKHYVVLAETAFAEALSTANELSARVHALYAHPSDAALQAARDAWIEARAPYSRTEVFRFGNPNVDAWEGLVNAWPMDEGLIDYVEMGRYAGVQGNPLAQANYIAGDKPITGEALRALHEAAGSEANVATGYHAIEFLLWGQDLNQPPDSAGTRPYTDYADGEACTNGNCDRRREYLRVVTTMLVEDLKHMHNDWVADTENYRAQFLALAKDEALRRIFSGLTNLAQAELSGERIRVALLANSQEDEQSCFSDNTHNDIANNFAGIRNVITGVWVSNDGSRLDGPAVIDLVEDTDAGTADRVLEGLEIVADRISDVAVAAAGGEPFDLQVAASNPAGAARLNAVMSGLGALTAAMEAGAESLGVPPQALVAAD